jgi:hypothetical protein
MFEYAAVFGWDPFSFAIPYSAREAGTVGTHGWALWRPVETTDAREGEARDFAERVLLRAHGTRTSDHYTRAAGQTHQTA